MIALAKKRHMAFEFIGKLIARMDLCAQVASRLAEKYSTRCVRAHALAGVLQMLTVVLLSVSADFLRLQLEKDLATVTAADAQANASLPVELFSTFKLDNTDFAVNFIAALCSFAGGLLSFLTQSLGWERYASNLADVASAARLCVRQLHEAQMSPDDQNVGREYTSVLSVEEEFRRLVPDNLLLKVLPSFSRTSLGIKKLLERLRHDLRELHRSSTAPPHTGTANAHTPFAPPATDDSV